MMQTETHTSLDAILEEMIAKPEGLTSAVVKHWVSEALREIQRLREVLSIAILPQEQWENCPNCSNLGFTVRMLGENRYEQEQCKFCWTNPRSVFYQENKLWKETE